MAISINDYLQWSNMTRKIKKTPDMNGKVVLTNFSNDKLEIYKKSIELYKIKNYEKSQKCQFEIKENVAHDINGRSLNKESNNSSSLWYLSVGDLSDFWRVFEEVDNRYKLDHLRKKKLKRILE